MSNLPASQAAFDAARNALFNQPGAMALSDDGLRAALAAAQPHFAAEERARQRSLLPYHIPCCENFAASVGDLINEHGDLQ